MGKERWSGSRARAGRARDSLRSSAAANLRAGSRRGSSTRLERSFWSAASAAPASMKSPRSQAPESRRSTRDFPGKEALFAAVVERLVRRNTSLEAILLAQALDSRSSVCKPSRRDFRTEPLRPETIGLIRSPSPKRDGSQISRRSVSRMARERPAESVARLLAKLASPTEMDALPAFAPDRLPETARRFLDLAVLPMRGARCSARIWPPCAPKSVRTS